MPLREWQSPLWALELGSGGLAELQANWDRVRRHVGEAASLFRAGKALGPTFSLRKTNILQSEGRYGAHSVCLWRAELGPMDRIHEDIPILLHNEFFLECFLGGDISKISFSKVQINEEVCPGTKELSSQRRPEPAPGLPIQGPCCILLSPD